MPNSDQALEMQRLKDELKALQELETKRTADLEALRSQGEVQQNRLDSFLENMQAVFQQNRQEMDELKAHSLQMSGALTGLSQQTANRPNVMHIGNGPLPSRIEVVNKDTYVVHPHALAVN